MLLGPARTVYLRTLGAADVSNTYLAWMRDPVVTRFLEARFQEHTLESLTAWVDDFDDGPSELYGIFLNEDDRHVGNCALHVDARHDIADFGYLVGDRALWGTTVTMEAVVLLLDHAFEALGLRKVHGGAYRSNLASVFNYKRLGFVREGVRRAHQYDGSEPTDVLLFGMLADEWRAHRSKLDRFRIAA
jgi:[ribosomal protein S5]-alanine N-acetyltransferase